MKQIMEILNFAFQDIYHFLGVLILLSASLNGLAAVLSALRKR